MIFHDRGNPVKYFSTSWETAQQKHQQAFFWIFCFSQFFLLCIILVVPTAQEPWRLHQIPSVFITSYFIKKCIKNITLVTVCTGVKYLSDHSSSRCKTLLFTERKPRRTLKFTLETTVEESTSNRDVSKHRRKGGSWKKRVLNASASQSQWHDVWSRQIRSDTSEIRGKCAPVTVGCRSRRALRSLLLLLQFRCQAKFLTYYCFLVVLIPRIKE